MNELLESPLLIVGMGVMLVIMLGSGLIKTGRRELIYAIAAAVLVFSGLLVAERLIKTDKEQVRDTVYQIAADVQRNDLEAILAHVHPQPKNRALARARNELPLYNFEEVRVTRIKDVVEKGGIPPSITARFMVRARGAIGGQPFEGLRFIVVDFRKHDDGWKVWDYSHMSPDQAFKNTQRLY